MLVMDSCNIIHDIGVEKGSFQVKELHQNMTERLLLCNSTILNCLWPSFHCVERGDEIAIKV